MASLGKKELQDLDEEIDRSIGSEAILSLPRDIAMINLLRSFEDYCRLFAQRTSDFQAVAALMKRGQDGMQFAVDWIHRYCPAPTADPVKDINLCDLVNDRQDIAAAQQELRQAVARTN